MGTIESELTRLKEQALVASARNDRDFYAGHLADDARAILPIGVLDKAAVLASMTGDRAPFAANRVEDTIVRPIGDCAGVVTYRAIYEGEGGEFAVVATTVYERCAGHWRGVLYQQTPVP